MALNYNAPIEGQKSSIDGAGSDQMNTFFWLKKSLIESRKEQYFMPLSSTTNMPKHFGKTIKVHEYVPLLDDRNINDQGIDAAGVVMTPGTWDAIGADGSILQRGLASKAAALAVSGAVRALEQGGNLYGSSKDVGTITGKIPTLTENGGRVNRVGFTRLSREGSLHKMGFFYEFTKESLDFDSDSELKDHLSRELMNGAVQYTEAILQMDLLAAAGTVLYAGAASSDDEMTGEETPENTTTGTPAIPASLLSYRDLIRMDQMLTDNRTPKQTKIIAGSRMIDTRVVGGGRIAFVGSEVVPWLMEMRDLFGNKAFIEVQHYADAGTMLNGEIGAIGPFRFVQVPEMLHWAGVGAEVDENPGYRSSLGEGNVERYDVFPILVVGNDSFVNIGFQTDGKTVKFNVITKMPGPDTADAYNDPYGEKGFSSIKWYYGILIKRPERIGLFKTVAPI